MKLLNVKYKTLFDRVKNIHINKEGKTYENQAQKTPEKCQWLIAELLKSDSI